MKTAKLAFVGLLMALLISMPVAADAHWGFGGGLVLGLGTGLITGFAFAPRPVYVAPPVYYAPPPPAGYYPSYVPPPPAVPNSTAYGYSNGPGVSSANPPPVGQSRCREWKMINRHWEQRWDSYYGRWRNVLVERWGWAGVPCNH